MGNYGEGQIVDNKYGAGSESRTQDLILTMNVL